MSLLCFLLVVSANYYLLFVLPTRIPRKQLLIAVGLSFLAFVGLSVALSWLQADPFVVGALHQSFGAKVLSSIKILIMLSFMNQASSLILDRVVSFHQEYNAENVHRQPIRLFVEHKATIQKVATSFWMFASVLILYAIWLRA